MVALNSSKKSLNYAIIGGLGFLGQHLVHELLSQNDSNSIRVIDKISSLESCRQLYPEDFKDKRVELVLGIDISNENDCEGILKDIDVLFHAAAVIGYGRKNKELLDKVNVRGVENIVKYAKEMSVQKIVYVSSFATLGCLDNKDKDQLASENCKKDWDSHSYYGISKYLGETCALNGADDNLIVVVAIPGVLLGPGPCHHASTLPFQIVLNQKWAVVPEGGSGYIDVRDAASGLVALSKEKCDKYLLVSYNLEHKELLQQIAITANKQIKIIVVPRFFSPLFSAAFTILEWFLPANLPYSKEGAIQAFKYRYFTSKKLIDQSKWRPKYSLLETLKDTIDWMRISR